MKINRGKLAQEEHDELLEYSKKDFDKLVEEAKLVQDGKIAVKVKLIKLPTPMYSDEQSQTVRGVGEGEEKGKKSYEALDGTKGGNEHADYEYKQIDFEEFVRYYQKLLLKDLDLPFMSKKKKGANPKEEFELNDFSREGMRCDLDLDLTVEQSYERAFREKKEVDVDPRIDGWYWEEKPTKEQNHKSLEIYVMDVSGSVSSSILGLVRKLIFCLYYYLDKKYSKNDRRYIVFQDTAEVKTRDEFFSIESRGGTHISSGLEKALELADGYEDYDKYLFFFSDFENSSSDDERAENALANIADSFTYICMTNVNNTNSLENSPFGKFTKDFSKKYNHLAYTALNHEDKIKDVIIHFLTKDERTKKI